MNHRYISRVDKQVSMLMALIITFSVLLVFISCTYVSYTRIIDHFEDHVKSVHNYLEHHVSLEKASQIYSKNEINTELYKNTRSILQNIRELAQLRYLYTATKNDKGELIYVVDGLPLNADGTPVDPEDYRYPGDLIEDEIKADVQKALNGFEVLPKGILGTSWGTVYVAYVPIYDKFNTRVVGVLGLEFSATDELSSFVHTAKISLVIGLVFIIFATLLSIKLFRKISNPLYKDLVNTDLLTNLKNRNSFEIDTGNIINLKQSKLFTVVMIDLNNLKKANDLYGHDVGDEYIKTMSQSLLAVENDTQGIYRYGGDEFVILSLKEQDIQKLLNRIKDEFDLRIKDLAIEGSYSIGFASFDEKLDRNLFDTRRRADEEMYRDKMCWHNKKN